MKQHIPRAFVVNMIEDPLVQRALASDFAPGVVGEFAIEHTFTGIVVSASVDGHRVEHQFSEAYAESNRDAAAILEREFMAFQQLIRTAARSNSEIARLEAAGWI